MEILILLFLILLNGIFSMSEIALVSARKSRLESAAKRGDKNARIALDTALSPNKFLSTVQIGITLIGILMGIISGENITNDLQAWVEKYPILKEYSHSIAVAIVVILITFFSLVLGELVPKRIGLAYPELISKVMARPMKALSAITAPFVWLLTHTGDLIIKVLQVKTASDTRVTEEEIKQIIQEGTDGGEVQEIEQDIVERVFHLGDRKVSSLMTHRNDIVFLDLLDSASDIRKQVSEELHSVYPVIEGEKDNIRGVVLLKDLFTHIDDDIFALKDYLKPPKFLIENTSAYKALQQFKDTKIHFGIITDEYGQIQGMVTMNDLLEALVGGADDFYANEFSFEEREDGSWLIDGHYPFHDFIHNFDLDDLSSDFEFNTLGGLVLHQLNHLPRVGEKVSWKDFEIEVIDMDGAKIDKLLVHKRDH